MRTFTKALFTALAILPAMHSSLPAQNSAHIVWAHQFKGQYETFAKHLTLDNTGGMVVAGDFIDVTDFDLSPQQANKGSAVYQDMFVAKYGPTGNLLWAATFEGYGVNDRLDDLIVHPNGDISITGRFDLTLDADPGPGVTALSGKYCVITLNAAGQYKWSAAWNGSNQLVAEPHAFSAAGTPSGGVVLFAPGDNQTDMDPGPGTSMVTNLNNTTRSFMVELDANGQTLRTVALPYDASHLLGPVIYANGDYALAGALSGNSFDLDPGPGTQMFNSMTGSHQFLIRFEGSSLNLVASHVLSGYSRPIAIHLGPSEDLYLSSSFTGLMDLNPDPNVADNFSAQWGDDAVIHAFDPSFALSWYRPISGNGHDAAEALATDANGNLYFSGTLHGTMDFDGTAGVQSLTASGNRDGYIAKWSPAGVATWAQKFGTLNDDYGGAIAVDAAGDVYTTGRFIGTGDFNPGTAVHSMTSTGLYDAFIGKFTQNACANLSAQASSMLPADCVSPGSATMQVSGGTAPYSYMWDNGSTAASITANQAGVSNVTITDAGGCTMVRGAFIDGPSSFSGHDLDGFIIPQIFRVGIGGTTVYAVRNDGCLPVNAVVSITMDPNVTDLAFSVQPDSITGLTHHFSLGNLSYANGYSTVMVHCKPLLNAWFHGTVHFSMRLSPETGDANPGNNLLNLDPPVVNGWDPNDIQVFPAGVCDARYVDSDEALRYMIRFQNTGNAEALEIYVIDSLDTELDVSTLRVEGSSHPMVTEVLPGNVLKFRFDNINLPGVSQDEPGSHGYIVYTIQAHNSTADHSQLRNRADIYFDWNPAVLTNTVENTLIGDVPPCAPAGMPEPAESVRVYPNPSATRVTVEATGLQAVELWTVAGQRLRHMAASSDALDLDVQDLAPGMYIVVARTADGVQARSLMRQ